MKLRLEPRLPGDLPVGAILLTVLLFMPLGGYYIDHGEFSFAACGIKAQFGVPCLSCGATRATLHLLHGEPIQAFLMQPLIVTLYFFMFVWGIGSFWALLKRRTYFPELTTVQGLAIVVGSIFVVGANWLYLLKAGI